MSDQSVVPWAVGFQLERPFVVTSEQLSQFGTLSGDVNPLHVDATFARAHGLADRVVYGGLIVAGISRVLGMELPGTGWMWHSLDIDFKRPLYVGQPARFIATIDYLNEELGVMQIAFTLAVHDTIVARGKVQSGRLPPVRSGS